MNNESDSDGELDLNLCKKSDVESRPNSAMFEDRAATDKAGASAFRFLPVKTKGPEPIKVRPIQDLLLPVNPNHYF